MITEKLTTIARPYALAAFEYALDNHDLLSWEIMLQTAAEIVKNKMMAQLLNNPNVSSKELAEMVCDILAKAKQSDEEKKNFIHLLVEYDRLAVLPEIAQLFASYRANYEKRINVEVTSAIPLDDKYQQKFVDALTRRLKRKVTLDCKVDAALLGGAMIRAGDTVIDGTVRGKLNRLLESL